jgi:hypothetical protein
MTRAEAQAALIAKVEAGEWTVTHWRDFDVFDGAETADTPRPVLAHRSYHGSLDAAKELHEAVLPEWEWTIFFNNTTGHMAVLDGPDFSTPEIGGESPARAWLLAILRALHAMEGDE